MQIWCVKNRLWELEKLPDTQNNMWWWTTILLACLVIAIQVSSLVLRPIKRLSSHPSTSRLDFRCLQHRLRESYPLRLADTSVIYESSTSEKRSLFLVPQRLRNLGTLPQTVIVLIYYTLHVVVFPHYEFVLDPMNDYIYEAFNRDVGFCLDDIVGTMVFLGTWMYHKVNNLTIPRLFNVSDRNVPWGKITLSSYQGFSVVISIFGLYYWSGTLYPAFHTLSNLLALVLPLTVPIQRNLEVLLLHMAWVAPSVALLKKVDHFFPRKTQDLSEGGEADSITKTKNNTNLWGTRRGKSAWWASTGNTNWAWWVVGGYAASVLIFRVADAINGLVLPVTWAAEHESNIVSRMVSYPGASESLVGAGVGAGAGAASYSAPGLGLGKFSDTAALLIGAVAPCLSAPWWEEMFYRGFVYPWLASFLPMLLATPGSALIFAAHHAQRDAFLPLAAMGLVWALLYLVSGNLLVVMLVHAMWNSKIFLNGLLSLLYM